MQLSRSDNSRIADLDTEAKEARKLKSDLANAATEIIELKNKVALAEQQGVSDEKNLADIKTRLQKKDTALDQLRIDLQQAKDTANQQVISLTKEHAGEKGGLVVQLEIQTQKIAVLESQLIKNKKK